MTTRDGIPDYSVYGEPVRAMDAGFLHVETVMARKSVHFGHVDPHLHSQSGQITWWFQGIGSYMIEGQSWTFSAPAISFVPSRVIHGFEVAEGADAVVLSVSDGALQALASQTDLSLEAPVFVTGQPENRIWLQLETLIAMTGEEFRENGIAHEMVLTGLIATILSLVQQLGGSAARPLASPEARLALDLRMLVNRHFGEEWTVARFVSELGTTPYLLDKAVRAIFGRPVKQMVMERRLLEAKRLLNFTIRSVEDIGRDSGFDDPAYFSRFLRKQTGEAPSDWRRRHAGANQ
jgi:AraC family transcriptional activator of pobA